MVKKVMIYGAYGYTGKLITEHVVENGLKPIIAGRNEEKTSTLAKKYQLDFKVFSLDDPSILVEALEDIYILLNAAGPYSKTAEPLVNASIASKTHYLDITGEIEVFEWIAAKNEQAKKAGIILLPGCGFDVVPTDCLAAMLKTKMPEATNLNLAFMSGGASSRGTTLTMLENLHKGGKVRENGKLTNVPLAYDTRYIMLNRKKTLAVTIPWGDVSTAYFSTGIPNIKVFMAVDKKMLMAIKLMNYLKWLFGSPIIQKYLARQIKAKMTGPDPNLSKNRKSYLWGEIKSNTKETLELFLETPEGYQLTAKTSVLIIKKILEENIQSGFLTPSKAFGEKFILEIPGTSLNEKY